MCGVELLAVTRFLDLSREFTFKHGAHRMFWKFQPLFFSIKCSLGTFRNVMIFFHAGSAVFYTACPAADEYSVSFSGAGISVWVKPEVWVRPGQATHSLAQSLVYC